MSWSCDLCHVLVHRACLKSSCCPGIVSLALEFCQHHIQMQFVLSSHHTPWPCSLKSFVSLIFFNLALIPLSEFLTMRLWKEPQGVYRMWSLSWWVAQLDILFLGHFTAITSWPSSYGSCTALRRISSFPCINYLLFMLGWKQNKTKNSLPHQKVKNSKNYLLYFPRMFYMVALPFTWTVLLKYCVFFSKILLKLGGGGVHL